MDDQGWVKQKMIEEEWVKALRGSDDRWASQESSILVGATKN